MDRLAVQRNKNCICVGGHFGIPTVGSVRLIYLNISPFSVTFFVYSVFLDLTLIFKIFQVSV